MAVQHSIVLNRSAHSLTLLAGLALCLVSVVYTVLLTTDLATALHEQVLLGICGIGFEICKFVFLPLGLVLVAKGFLFRGLPLLLTGALLVAISISASLGFLVSRTDQGAAQARLDSPEYRMYQAQLETLSAQIQTLQSKARIDAGSQWAQVRDRASQTTDEINALEAKRSEIMQRMQAIDGDALTSAGSLFSGLAQLFHSPAETIKTAGFGVVAVLIELCALVALSVSGVGSVRAEITSESNTTGTALTRSESGARSESNADQPRSIPEQVAGRADTGTEGRTGSRYKRVSAAIKAGRVKPSIRAVMRSEGVSYPVARQYFDELEQAGVIIRKGREYALSA